jgi:imidazoleglycerol-phosphate dehydratase
MTRKAQVQRTTGETQVELSIDLDGSGAHQIETGVGFLDHMLSLFSKHSLFDLRVAAKGDLHIDAHHTVEDVGICLGLALRQALGEKAGVARYGYAVIPMDETLASVAVDLSGRAYFVWRVNLPVEMLGTFNSPLAEEFWRAVAFHALLNLHVDVAYGTNSHHIIEAIFKAAAVALRRAAEVDPRRAGVPSTKGVL